MGCKKAPGGNGMNKIMRNSVLSILAGLLISVGACYIGKAGELVNYIGAMFVFGGFIFLDQRMVEKCWPDNSKLALIRLPIYLLLSVVLILIPLHMEMSDMVMRCLRSIGISCLILALWRFFTFTTVEEEKIHKN